MKLSLSCATVYLLLSLQSLSCYASQQRLLQKRAFGLLRKHGSQAAQTAAGRTSVANVVTASSSVATLPFAGSAATSGAATATSTVAQQSLRSSKGFLTFSHRATRLQQQLQRSYSLRAIFLDVLTNKPGSASSRRKSTTGPHSRHQSSEELRTMMHPSSSSLPGTALWHDVQRIAGGTVAESWNGFVGGYLLATGLDVTKRLYWKVIATSWQPSSLAVATRSAEGTMAAAATSWHQLPYPGLRAFSQETLLMHARSRRFGMEWAQMSAVFCASRGLVKILRQQRHDRQFLATSNDVLTTQQQITMDRQQRLLDDEWDTVLGGGVAGAAFSALARKGPVAMAQGALLYGTTMFVLHPQLWKSGLQAMMLTPPNASLPPLGETAAVQTNTMGWLDGLE